MKDKDWKLQVFPLCIISRVYSNVINSILLKSYIPLLSGINTKEKCYYFIHYKKYLAFIWTSVCMWGGEDGQRERESCLSSGHLCNSSQELKIIIFFLILLSCKTFSFSISLICKRANTSSLISGLCEGAWDTVGKGYELWGRASGSRIFQHSSSEPAKAHTVCSRPAALHCELVLTGLHHKGGAGHLVVRLRVIGVLQLDECSNLHFTAGKTILHSAIVSERETACVKSQK